MKDFKKYFIVPEEPEVVYRGLTNPDVIRLWSGAPALMSETPDSEFSLWEGSILGRNIEFEPGRKVVQEWFFGEEEPSMVTMLLHPHKDGTSVELRHTNIPEEAWENITQGWIHQYFGALVDFYSGQ